jgi:HEAT repeat protein
VAQERNGQTKPQQEISQPKSSVGNPAPNQPHQEGQLLEPKFSLARVTFLDGSTQQWGNLRFAYENSRLPSKNSPSFMYLAGSIGSMLISDNVIPTPGDRVEAVYSQKPEFMHVLLGVKGVEGRIVGRNCAGDTPCIGSEGINVQGVCIKGGQRKECSACLVPLESRAIPDKGSSVKEIVFIPESEAEQVQQTALFNRIPADTPGDVSQAIEELYSFNPQKRADAANRLREMGLQASPAVPFLVDTLSDEEAIQIEEKTDIQGRVNRRYTTPSVIAIKALGEIGKPAVEPLIASLNDRENDLSVRKNAAIALGETNDPKIVEPLIAALKEKDKALRTAAIEALGKVRIKDSQTFESILVALSDVLKDRNTRSDGGHVIEVSDHRAAMRVMVKMKDPRAVEPLIGALKHEDEYVRIEAAEALGEVKDPRTVDPLIAALKDEDARVQESAADSLGRMGARRAIEPLIQALQQSNKYHDWRNISFGISNALKTLTGQDFGKDHGKWQKWWLQNKEREL